MKRKIAAFAAIAVLLFAAAFLASCSPGGSGSTSGSSSASSGGSNGSGASKASSDFYAVQSFTVHYTDGTLTSTTYTYENGAIASEAVNSQGTTTKASYADYDKIGMPWAETINGTRYDLKINANPAGLPLSLGVDGAAVRTEYEYDSNNSLKTCTVVNTSDNSVFTKVSYGEDGYVSTVQNSYGDVARYTYDKGSDGKISKLKIENTLSDGNKVNADYSVTVDEVGNVTALVDADGFKVYEAHYTKMNDATLYVKTLYGSPICYWG
ncbi:MAG: hypothetical protein MJ189_03710 [Coriobacteriales bacterium]|nr:hypothetical protein [Coriobacteriales bacterium]